jgi:hypothetical protein
MKMRFGKRKAHYLEGHMGRIREVIMKDLYHFNGQAGYIVDAGRLKKMSVVFGMIDEKRTWMAWYDFVSYGKPKSKRELAIPHHVPLPHWFPGRSLMLGVPTRKSFGHRLVGGVDIPHTFEKKTGLGDLAIHPKGTDAALTLDISGSKRFIDCRISRLRTKAKEVVTFPFILQYGSDPSWKSPINGMVRFQGIVRFDANRFPEGPDWARSPAGW